MILDELDYSLGGSCSEKLRHLRDGLPRNDTDNTFAHWMRAEAGKLDAVARHLFPTAIDVSGRHDVLQLLRSGKCTVANATFATKDASCRVDFATRDGDAIRLYQVVPKSVDFDLHNRQMEFTGQSGALRKEWRGHLELAAFRVWVVKQLFPDARVVPLLVVPVQGAVTNLEGLHGYFEKTDRGWTIGGLEAVTEATKLVRIVSVTEYCAPIIKHVPQKIAAINRALNAAPAPDIGYRCKSCEFSTGPDGGLARCWGKLSEVSPHMFDLGYMYFIQDPNGRPVADRLAKAGTVSLFDVPDERIRGEHARRQRMQIEGTRHNKMIIDPTLVTALRNLSYPIKYLDVEALRAIFSPHRDVPTQGLSMFEFSLHTRRSPGAPLEHVEWLNEAHACPNRRFLSALRTALGDAGAVLIYTEYERVSLEEMLNNFITAGEENDDMIWLRGLLSGPRLIDLHKLFFAGFFHPGQKGRTSIKPLLRAVWSEPSPLKSQPPYNEFPPDIDPYEFLKRTGGVADGCDAMTAYLELQSHDRAARIWAAGALRRYNYADTLFMEYLVSFILSKAAEGKCADLGLELQREVA